MLYEIHTFSMLWHKVHICDMISLIMYLSYIPLKWETLSTDNYITYRHSSYRMAQMFDGRKFDKFDKSKLHCQNFPYQYFAIGMQEFKHLYL